MYYLQQGTPAQLQLLKPPELGQAVALLLVALQQVLVLVEAAPVVERPLVQMQGQPRLRYLEQRLPQPFLCTHCTIEHNLATSMQRLSDTLHLLPRTYRPYYYRYNLSLQVKIVNIAARISLQKGSRKLTGSSEITCLFNKVFNSIIYLTIQWDTSCTIFGSFDSSIERFSDILVYATKSHKIDGDHNSFH